jgi:hypothetical protein
VINQPEKSRRGTSATTTKAIRWKRKENVGDQNRSDLSGGRRGFIAFPSKDSSNSGSNVFRDFPESIDVQSAPTRQELLSNTEQC